MDEDKKAERKRKRFAARLKSSKGINVIETPVPNLVLCNAGQATGFEKTNILNIIQENNLNIQTPKYVAEKGESHSFLVFSSTGNATLFYNICNGRAKSDEKGTPLYMSYVENVPDLETICPHDNPSGLTILPNFITQDEEKNFLNIFNFTSDSNLKNRQVKHYGYEFRYGTNDVDLNSPLDERIPKECDVLWRRLEECGFQLGVPDQLTVNKYCPGQGKWLNNLVNVFNFTSDSNLKNRQVKHYGYEFRYDTNDVDLNSPLDERIPKECDVLWRRLEECGFQLGVPDQLTVNKYCPEQGKWLNNLVNVFNFTSDSNLKNRQVKHYGYEFRYGTNDVDLNSPLDERIPKECDVLWRRLEECGFQLGVPDQLTANKYCPGQGKWLNNFVNIFNFTTDSNLKNRQVKHYGYEFRYGTNDVDLNSPLDERIPKECDVLWRRLEECGFQLGVPDQLTINKYCPGQGIPTHVDRHSPFGSTILSLSLNSDVVMEWKHHTGKLVPVVVPARSMLTMQDEARYDWQHGIQPRTFDPIIENRTINDKTHKIITTDTTNREMRISLTFRWTRQGPCECGFKTLCDSSSNGDESGEIDDKLASNLEELHVHQVYEQIAGHFSSTRHTPWPRVVEFLKKANPGDLVIDLGAGNGKNILPRCDIMQIACERSSGLVSECSSHNIGNISADCMRLDMLYAPLRTAVADKVICIAVVHHFTTRSRRLQALKTIYDLLRPSGLALITVWAKDQTKSNYLCKNKLPTEYDRLTVAGVTLPVHENRTQFQHQDLLVPWKLRKKTNNKLENTSQSTLLRYYHVFDETELDELCTKVGFVIEDSFYEEGNWCVVCKRL